MNRQKLTNAAGAAALTPVPKLSSWLTNRPAAPRKTLQQRPRLPAKTPCGTVVWWFKTRFGKKVDDAAAGAGFRIGRAVDEARDARVKHGAGAHGARLEGHVELAAAQTIVPEPLRSVAQCADFGVGSRIVTRDRAVVALTDDLAVFHDDCADRELRAAPACSASSRRARMKTRVNLRPGSQFYSHSIVAGGLLEMS